MIASSGVDHLVAIFMPYLAAVTVGLLVMGWFVAVAMSARNRLRMRGFSILVDRVDGAAGRRVDH